MKVSTHYGSIWDELPVKQEPHIPTTQEEAERLHEAAEASTHDALMKTVDAHNESMRKSAELRRKTQQKHDIERRVMEQRERQREILEEEAVRRKRNAEMWL
ncbi:MAG: hypothetical protein IJP86_01740 [Synergistaceae bacterium]|nr:hypothetical protein [Synergistaceae bacterium]